MQPEPGHAPARCQWGPGAARLSCAASTDPGPLWSWMMPAAPPRRPGDSERGTQARGRLRATGALGVNSIPGTAPGIRVPGRCGSSGQWPGDSRPEDAAAPDTATGTLTLAWHLCAAARRPEPTHALPQRPLPRAAPSGDGIQCFQYVGHPMIDVDSEAASLEQDTAHFSPISLSSLDFA